MVIHESYECEYCGQVFGDENECETHELFCQYEHDKIHYDGNYCVRFFNRNGKELQLEENLDLANISGIYVEGEEAIDWVIRFFDWKGYCSPWDNTWETLEKENGFYYFDADEGDWKMPDKMIEYWQSVKKDFNIQ